MSAKKTKKVENIFEKIAKTLVFYSDFVYIKSKLAESETECSSAKNTDTLLSSSDLYGAWTND